MHSHCLILPLPATEVEFTGQLSHDVTDTAAVALLYKSTPQNVQAMEPALSLYDPASHAKHSPPFAPVNPWLQRHVLETLLPPGESEFAGQSVHMPEAEAPTLVEYFPAIQSVHATVPLSALYFPATHAEHVPPSGPVYPVLQKQEVLDCCAVIEVHVFCGQAVQAADPSSCLYLPVVHAEHTPPFDPVYPDLHRQAVMDSAFGSKCPVFSGHDVHFVEPVSEYRFTPQLMQVLATEAPTAVEYLPAAQATHELATKAPAVSEYFPAQQSTQELFAEEPTVTEYLPAPQFVQELSAAVVRYLPATQSLHVAATEAPTTAENVPAPQPMQVLGAVAPRVTEYFPAVQSEHAEPASEYLPAAQPTQAVEVVDPDGEDVPALQLEHTSEPKAALCFPTTHAVHVPPFTPVYPALHWHPTTRLLPLAESEFAGQSVHVLFT